MIKLPKDARLFTNSELGDMRRCPRKWYLTNYKKFYQPSETINEAQYTGTLVHFSVADFYNSDGKQDPLSTLTLMAATDRTLQEEMLKGSNDAVRSIIEQNIETIDKSEELALIMVAGYVEWLQEEGADSYLTFISAEEEVAIAFPAEGMPKAGAHLLAKLDARFLDERSGARVFMDHKTVQNFADREKWAHLDPQFLFYSLIDYLMHLDEPDVEFTDGGIINMLRKVKRTARSKPPFYKRVDVRHSVLELKNYFIRVAGEIARIQQAEISLDMGIDHRMICPPSPTRDCAWDCRFFQACGLMDDGSDISMYFEATFKVGNPLRRYEEIDID